MIDTSEKTEALFAALSKFQAACHGAGKGGKNPHLRNTYTRLEDAWAAARGPLTDNGLSVVQMPCVAAEGHVGVATRLCHSSGQWLQSVQQMPVAVGKGTTPAQAVGSAMSYARRYAFLAALGLPSVDDDGEAAGRGPRGAPRGAAPDTRLADGRAMFEKCVTSEDVDICIRQMADYPNGLKMQLAGAHSAAVERTKAAS